MLDIVKGDLDRGVPLTWVQDCLKVICGRNNKLVGLALHEDLHSLLFSSTNTFDIGEFFVGENGKPNSLSFLALHVLALPLQQGLLSSVCKARYVKKLTDYMRDEQAVAIREGRPVPTTHGRLYPPEMPLRYEPEKDDRCYCPYTERAVRDTRATIPSSTLVVKTPHNEHQSGMP